MVVGSAHTRVLVRDWVLVRDVGSTNAFEAVRRKATAGKMRTSIFEVSSFTTHQHVQRKFKDVKVNTSHKTTTLTFTPVLRKL